VLGISYYEKRAELICRDEGSKTLGVVQGVTRCLFEHDSFPLKAAKTQPLRHYLGFARAVDRATGDQDAGVGMKRGELQTAHESSFQRRTRRAVGECGAAKYDDGCAHS
jgi:hypothetical protein